MKNHCPRRHQAKELPHLQPRRHHLGLEQLAPHSTLDSDEYRGAHRSEGHRRALDHHSDHHGCRRRKPHSHHERRTHRSGRSEPRGTFDERTEEPPQEDDLDPPVVTDGMEGTANGRHPTRVLQGVEEQEGSENDEEQVEGQEKPLDGCGPNPDPLHLPGPYRHRHSSDVHHGHGPFGGDPKPHQKQTGEKNGPDSEEGLRT